MITAKTTQYGTMGHDFCVNGSSMIVDFCSHGDPVPVNFQVSVTRSAHIVSPAQLVANTIQLAQPDPSTPQQQSDQVAALAPVENHGASLVPLMQTLMVQNQGIFVGSAGAAAAPIPECGKTWNPPGIRRVTNGIKAQLGNFPWTVALVHKHFKQVLRQQQSTRRSF